MQQISISQARQMLPSLINRVFNGEEFVIVKNNLRVAQIIPLRDTPIVQKQAKTILPEAVNLFSHLKGTTNEVADMLRKRAWTGSYDD